VINDRLEITLLRVQYTVIFCCVLYWFIHYRCSIQRLICSRYHTVRELKIKQLLYSRVLCWNAFWICTIRCFWDQAIHWVNHLWCRLCCIFNVMFG